MWAVPNTRHTQALPAHRRCVRTRLRATLNCRSTISARHWWKAFVADASAPLRSRAFPKYVWGWLDGDLYEARHINGPAGTYKGYKLQESEYPRDPVGCLNWKGSE